MVSSRRRGALASVNLQFSSFAPRHRLSELISALGLASVATATRYDSVACDEWNFSSSEERALAPLGLSPPRSFSKRHIVAMPFSSAALAEKI